MITKIGFGGGCHWCTESVFLALKGVQKVEQGWIASFNENDTFSEAVIVHFNNNQIDLNLLVEIHLKTHSSTSSHSMRGKYRSAVYTFEDTQIPEVQDIINNLQNKFDNQLITKIHPFRAFKPSPEQFINYYIKNPKKPFCEKYITPKLQSIENQFSGSIKDEYHITFKNKEH